MNQSDIVETAHAMADSDCAALSYGEKRSTPPETAEPDSSPNQELRHCDKPTANSHRRKSSKPNADRGEQNNANVVVEVVVRGENRESN